MSRTSKRKKTPKRSRFFWVKATFYGLLTLFALAWFFTPSVLPLKTTQPLRSAFMATHSQKARPIKFVSLENISPHLVRAVLLAEDNLFFEHSGFDWESLWKAFQINWKKKKYVLGASTLTQQLAKNLFLSSEQSLWRKAKEAMITLKLEAFLTKRRILELYLNYAEMGPNVYGVAAASRYHFGKKPHSLTQREASLLAATLINGKFFGKRPYPKRTLKRQKKILYRMKNYALFVPKDFFKTSPKPSYDDEKDISNLIKEIEDDDAKELWEYENLESQDIFLDE